MKILGIWTKQGFGLDVADVIGDFYTSLERAAFSGSR